MFYRQHPGWHQHGGGLFWLIPFLLFLALVGVAVYLVIRASSHGRLAGAGGASGPRGFVAPGPGGSGPGYGPGYGPGFGPGFAPGWAGGPRYGPDPAMDHARMRYARGEMSREEYLRLVADLGGGAGSPAGASSTGFDAPTSSFDAPAPPPPPPPPEATPA